MSGRWRLGLGSALNAGLLGVALASITAAGAETQAPAVSQDDLQALLRTGQLAQWLGEPVFLAQGLCIQERYALRWPTAQSGPETEQAEDALRMARERCAESTTPSAPGGTVPTTRLVSEAKAEFRRRLQRLYGPQLAIRACRQQSEEAASLDECLRLALGRPLSAQEQRWLLAAGGE
jgi:hypothetical protein